MVGGDDDGSYTSSPVVDVNDDGIGYVGVSTYFLGGDQGTSQYSNFHTIAFKMTEDFGASWFGGQEGSNYFFIDDNVYTHMLDTEAFEDSYTDEQTGEEITWTELFCTYDFDLLVDSQGNPHIIVGLLPASDDGVYPGISDDNGFWHFTIDKDYLLNPGAVGSETGWNYSFVVSAQDSWIFDTDATGGEANYWQVVFPSLAISEESDDVMYVVSSMVAPGPFTVTDDGGTPDDPSDDMGFYYEWSEDVFVIKSENGGDSWWAKYNASNTSDPDPEDDDSPEETYAQASPSGATDDIVYICYQMPDIPYGSTTGDLGNADFKNRLYAGYVVLDTEPEDLIDIETFMTTGWNWFSINVTDNNMSLNNVLGSVEGSATYIKDQTSFAEFVPGLGWLGQLTDIDPKSLYKMTMDQSGWYNWSGLKTDETSPIDLSAGWNWIGYLPQDDMAIDNALASIGADGIYIKNQSTFAQYVAPLQSWLGQLGEMKTLDGYMLQMANASSLTYVAGDRSEVTPQMVEDSRDTPAWEVVASNYEFTGSITSIVSIGDDVNDVLGVFVDGECRGTSIGLDYTSQLGHVFYTPTIYSNIAAGEVMTFQFYDASSDVVYDITGEITFEADMNLGGFTAPHEFVVLLDISGEDVPSNFSLSQAYPNPFNPSTTIEYAVASSADVSIIVYDMMGREVTTLVSGNHSPNNYSVVWNGMDNNGEVVSSGVYLYKMTSSNFVQMNKVLFVK
jgi:hypothetical protein